MSELRWKIINPKYPNSPCYFQNIFSPKIIWQIFVQHFSSPFFCWCNFFALFPSNFITTTSTSCVCASPFGTAKNLELSDVYDFLIFMLQLLRRTTADFVECWNSFTADDGIFIHSKMENCETLIEILNEFLKITRIRERNLFLFGGKIFSVYFGHHLSFLLLFRDLLFYYLYAKRFN